MSFIKIKYDERLARIEIWDKGGDSPRLSLTSEEFADALQQIFAFVEKNSPHVKQASQGRWKAAFGKSVRSEAWQWLGGQMKEKLFGFLRKKQ